MRLDILITQKGLARSRSKAKEYIEEGLVSVDGIFVTKAGAEVREDAQVVLSETEKYVSRAGRKLEHALDVFSIDVSGLSALDLGASTGGFTDCLLQRGASRVIALDVGRDQLASVLRENPRVTALEGINARDIGENDLPYLPEIVTTDLSFISQALVYPAVGRVLKKGYFISLIKPQFEAGRQNIGKGGIVKDGNGKIFKQILARLECEAKQSGLILLKTAPSPILGGDGNKEYLALFKKEETI